MHYSHGAQRLFREHIPLMSALGDSTRQELFILMLSDKPKSVQELADAVGLSRPTVSYHLKILRGTGIITEEKVGTRIHYKPELKITLTQARKLVRALELLDEASL